MFIKKLVNQVICDPDNPVVETKNGKLRGLIVDGTYIFRGVKYANAERFHMPVPVEKWDGVKDAISNQLKNSASWVIELPDRNAEHISKKSHPTFVF